MVYDTNNLVLKKKIFFFLFSISLYYIINIEKMN